MDITTIYTIIGVILSLIFILIIISIYNSLVNYSQTVKSSKSGIQVEYKKRFDLVPQAVEVAKQFVAHETKLMNELTKLRVDLKNSIKTNHLDNYVKDDKKFFGAFFAIAENYPALRSSELFHNLQNILNSTEENIAASRHIYNSNVDYYNSYKESFPANILSTVFSFETEEYLNFDEEIEKVIDVSTLFKSTQLKNETSESLS